EAIHEAGIGARIHHAVSHADGTGIEASRGGIGNLPDDFTGGHVERGPGAPGDRRTIVGERVRLVRVVADGDVDALAVGGGAPFYAAERAAGADDRAPHDVAGIGIESPVDAALLSEADDVR